MVDTLLLENPYIAGRLAWICARTREAPAHLTPEAQERWLKGYDSVAEEHAYIESTEE